jgi:hypothetical protein
MVLLVPEDPANNLALFRLDQSDTDGSFTLASVVPGKYMLMAIQDGWQLEWTAPDVIKKMRGHGQSLEVSPHGKYDLRIRVEHILASH